MAQWKQIWLGTTRLWVPSLALPSGLRIGIAVSCGVGRRCGLDLALLWLWGRPTTTAPIQTPSLGTSICHGCSPEKRPKKKKNFIYSLTWLSVHQIFFAFYHVPIIRQGIRFIKIIKLFPPLSLKFQLRRKDIQANNMCGILGEKCNW